MLKLASFLIVAVAMPALAEAPISTSESPKIIFNSTPTATTCYFIRQANHQLQATQDKPGFMPLAGVEKLPTTNPFANCTSDQRVIKTVIKTDIRK